MDEVCRRKQLSALCDESEFVTGIIKWWGRAKLWIKRHPIALEMEKRQWEQRFEAKLDAGV